jgi:hypothetical protein
MSQSDINRDLNGLNPLSYMGVNPTTPPQLVTENRIPTPNDYIRFPIGTLWLVPPTSDVFILTSKSGNVATWTQLSSGGGIISFTTDTGGPVVPAPGNIVTIHGTLGITTDGTVPNTITISGSGGGVTWSTINANTPAAIDSGYIVDGVGTIVITLPAVSPAGSVFKVTGINNATGWQIQANTGQTIHFGAVDTSVGGTLTSTGTYNSIEIVCSVADTAFNVLSSQGNITVA